MTCNEVRELIPAYLAGNVSPEEKRSVEEHSDICTDCSWEVSLEIASKDEGIYDEGNYPGY